MSPAQIVLGLATLAAFVYTVLAYPHKYGALSGRSRLFRTIGVSLLDLLLTLVLMATFIDFSVGVAKSVALFRMIFYESVKPKWSALCSWKYRKHAPNLPRNRQQR
jgi:hypothetical protein